LIRESDMELAEIVAGVIADAVTRRPDRIPIIGLSGPQGAGKSTLLGQLRDAMPGHLLALGIDDFYLPRADRRRLATAISPLFATRGPPGTHDMALLSRTLDAALQMQHGTPLRLPVFDKRSDDRLPPAAWRPVVPGFRAILLEGWLVGATLPPGFAGDPPINEVERAPGAVAWRRHQAEQLAGRYADLFDRIDAFIHLTAPDFGTVTAWRRQQEAATWRVAERELTPERRAFVHQFVQYFERITRSMAAGYRRPGTVIALDAERRAQPAVTSEPGPP